MRTGLLALVLATVAASPGGAAERVGSQVCAGCHASILKTQATSAMARTWQGKKTTIIPALVTERHAEGPAPAILYRLQRSAEAFTFAATLAGQPEQTNPIETTVGGNRHGISFLLRVPEIEGAKLPRAPLVEARYLHYVPHGRLELSPGFPTEKPRNYETALGRVLTPGFETKCLTCHGQPKTIGAHVETGVTCEDCHGGGSDHLKAVAGHTKDLRIENPARRPLSEQTNPCSQCHSGFSIVEDPLPDDLLISDQVTALKNSECWRQSGGQISCLNCHNPHQDAPRAALVTRSEANCLSCHSLTKKAHAAICPVNQKTGCVGCHMPDEKKPPLIVADHWIRVHGSAPVNARSRPEWKTQIAPQHMWLRMIAAADEASANELRARVERGESFFELARQYSTDKQSGANGGFLGDLTAEQTNPSWREAGWELRPGEISPVVKTTNGYVFLQRMPRDFREESERVYEKAMALRAEGKRQESAAQLLEALKIYPKLLRALTYLGITYGEGGQGQTAVGILSLAAKEYPQDAGAHFNLAVAMGSVHNPAELEEYQKALAIDPDLTTAWLNLGAALYAKGDTAGAIDAYRKGINANPLIASLHYSLSVALDGVGKRDEAQRELALAKKIDPGVEK